MRDIERSISFLVFEKAEAYWRGVKTAAVIMGGGSTAYPISTSAINKNFIDFRTKSEAASGDCRLAYLRHTLGGVTGGAGYGDCVRAFTIVTGTGYGYASGIHATLQLNAGATVTGSGAAGRFTVAAAAETRTLSGAIAGIQIDSDIGANNTVPATVALIRLAKVGSVDVTAFLNVTDDQCLKGSAATGAASDALKVIMPDGVTARYISLIAAS
jgi:hypothetical protein